eukprot:Skav210837  [mRNA]  locus=scaffold543:35453:36126:+ [translate_table: standard]
MCVVGMRFFRSQVFLGEKLPGLAFRRSCVGSRDRGRTAQCLREGGDEGKRAARRRACGKKTRSRAGCNQPLGVNHALGRDIVMPVCCAATAGRTQERRRAAGSEADVVSHGNEAGCKSSAAVEWEVVEETVGKPRGPQWKAEARKSSGADKGQTRVAK